jgi:rsbT co-antagonist protein RsbR
MPLIGAIDSRRSLTITANLLHSISQQRAQCVILDITGVPIVDTQIAQHLIHTSQACRLLGCDVVLVGIGVEIAQTLVQLGVDLSALVTLADLQAGIAWAFERRSLRVVHTNGAPSI